MGKAHRSAPAGIRWDPLASCEHLRSHQRSRGDATHLCGCILAELGDAGVRSRYLAMAGGASLFAFHHSAQSDWDGHTSMFCKWVGQASSCSSQLLINSLPGFFHLLFYGEKREEWTTQGGRASKLPPSLFSLSPLYGVRSMSVKARGTSSLGLSHHGTGCLSKSALPHVPPMSLSPFSDLCSPKKVHPVALLWPRMQSSAARRIFPILLQDRRDISTTHWLILGDVMFCGGGSSWIPLVSSPLSPASLPCALGCDQILPQMFLTVIFELFSEF